MHHPTDVLAGSTIGALSALIVYLIYWPSPFNSNDLSAMDKPNLVYGAIDVQEFGRVQLGLSEEGDDEGILRGRGEEEV